MNTGSSLMTSPIVCAEGEATPRAEPASLPINPAQEIEGGLDVSSDPAREPQAPDEEPIVELGARARWWLYVLLSADGRRTYVGITTALPRRLEQHNGERPGGARATRAGRPWRFGRVFGPYADRGEVSRAERALKAVRGLKRLSWPGGAASTLAWVPLGT